MKIKNWTTSIIVSVMLVVALFAIAPMTANAVPGYYHTGDIAVINAIIEKNPGLDWPKAPANGNNVSSTWAPGSWVGVKWSSAAPRRIIKLDVGNSLDVEVLDVRPLASLEYLDCGENYLTGVKVDGLMNLKELICWDNKLTNLDLSGLQNLQELYCGDNKIANLDLSGLSKLQVLDCTDNKLTSLDVGNLLKLQELTCSMNDIKALDLSRLSNLQVLYCKTDHLTKLNLSSLSNLKKLGFGGGELTDLDLSGLVNLTELSCSDTKLTKLNVNGLTKLEKLICEDGKLTSLSLSGLINLKELDCSSNNLKALNVSGLKNLRILSCRDNMITKLNVSSLKNLQQLFLPSNRLAKLDVSGLPKLKEIGCHDNKLKILKLNSKAPYSFIDISYNLMKSQKAVTGRNIRWDEKHWFWFSPQKTSFQYSLKSKTYNGKAHGVSVKPKASIKGFGKITVKYNGSKVKPKKAGAYVVTISAKGNSKYPWADNVRLGTFKINKINLSKAKGVKIADTIWTGGQKTPSKFTYNKSSFSISQTSFPTRVYGANTNIGKGTVKLTGAGNFTGTKTLTFKILPKKNAIAKLAPGKGKLKATWTRPSVEEQGITKYQVRYRVKGESKWSAVKTYPASASSATIKKLAKGKQYQIQVRSYKTVSGAKYYSAWSKAKISGKVK